MYIQNNDNINFEIVLGPFVLWDPITTPNISEALQMYRS